VKYAKKRRIPLDVPYRSLAPEQKHWVLYGDTDWIDWKKTGKTHWYGVKVFFDWLETKAYKMHIRVLCRATARTRRARRATARA